MKRTTPKAIYTAITGDRETHQRTIAAALKHESRRRRKIVELRAAGQSYRQIADQYGISHASVRSALILTMRAVYKRTHGEPRYNRVGRRRRPDTTRAKDLQHTPAVQTCHVLRELSEKGSYEIAPFGRK